MHSCKSSAWHGLWGSLCWQQFGLPSPFHDGVIRTAALPHGASPVLVLSQTAEHGLLALSFCTAQIAMLSALLFACITQEPVLLCPELGVSLVLHGGKSTSRLSWVVRVDVCRQ